MKTIRSVSPWTEEVLWEYKPHSPQEVNDKLEKIRSAQLVWKKTSFQERSKVMRNLAAALRDQRDTYAQLIHLEMGKSQVESLAEIEKCASCADYYAENGERFLRNISVPMDAKDSFIAFEPLGTVLAIMPWNFPFWQAFRAAIPAIYAGNGMALKHASNVSGCALAMEKIWQGVLTQKNLFQTFLIPALEAQKMIGHPFISAVTFTGSTPAGKAIAQEAGAHIKKCVLELGGSDPFLIFEDADLELAAKLATKSRLLNNGQSCISAKRFIVHKNVCSAFLRLLEGEFQKASPAPLARSDLREDLHAQVNNAIAEGATLVCGGTIPEGKGYFYPPTILSGVQKEMQIFSQETFGPVASVIEAKDEAHAIQLANATSFGLGAALFTKNRQRGLEILQFELEAGSCFLNDFVRSDSRLPFGGVKESGYGRELSEFGIREFVNIKTIYGN